MANHAFGLFELAALHLSLQPPQLAQARLAIDALAALVDGLGERLGDAAPPAVRGPEPAAHGVRADPSGQSERDGKCRPDRAGDSERGGRWGLTLGAGRAARPRARAAGRWVH